MHNQKDMMLNNQKLISRTRIPLIICKKLHSNSSYLKKLSMKLACHQYGCAAFYDPVSHRFAVVCMLPEPLLAYLLRTSNTSTSCMSFKVIWPP